MFSILVLVNVVTFVAVLWLFWFTVYLDFHFLHHIYHLILERFILCLPAHILNLNLWIIIRWNFILLTQKTFLVLSQFYVGPEIGLVLVEYWLTHFHPFFCIRNRWRRYFHCRCYLLICHTQNCQKNIHRNPLLQSRQNQILRCSLVFLSLRHVVQGCKCVHLFDSTRCYCYFGQIMSFYNLVGFYMQ